MKKTYKTKPKRIESNCPAHKRHAETSELLCFISGNSCTQNTEMCSIYRQYIQSRDSSRTQLNYADKG